MPLSIRTREQIYHRLQNNVSGEIAELTNFSTDSPEYVLLNGESYYLNERQHALLATQLSGWVEFAGGPVTTEKLEQIYTRDQIERIDLDLLNSMMVDYDLDQLAAANSVTRDPGSPAIGEVLITLSDTGNEVRAGTLVGTTPDTTGDYLTYRVTDERGQSLTPDTNAVTLRAPIEAVEVGPEYNIGSNLIEYVPGEQDAETSAIVSVTNPEATAGGEGPEENGPLRTRTKRAMANQSGGGTRGGIEGQAIEAFESLEDGDVRVIEHEDGQPELPETQGAPYMELLVDGQGISESALQAFMSRDDVFPVSIYATALRATRVSVDVDLAVVGPDPDTDHIGTAVTRYISDLSLGEDCTDGRVEYEAMNADDALIDADATFTVEGSADADDVEIGAQEVADPGQISISTSAVN